MVTWLPVEANLLIDGKRIASSSRLDVNDPGSPAERVGSVVRGTPAHVDAAVDAARRAQPRWAALRWQERAAILGRVLDDLAKDLESRAILYVRENGRTRAEADKELADVAPRARFTLELADQLDAGRELSAPNGYSRVRLVPYGVVLCIAPWNAPVSLACMQMIPALLAGNAVVLKPPESCPLSLIEVAERMARHLPAGILNIVTGLREEIGDALTGHQDIRKIAFVGSVGAARQIGANASSTIKSFTAELGGNDAAIVLEDALLDPDMMDRMTATIFRLAGQVCMAIKRIYVHDHIHDRFVDALRSSAQRLVIGHGLVSRVTMGPLHTKDALDHARALVDAARIAGCNIVEVGEVVDERHFAEGYFMRPTIVTEIGDDAELVTAEQFCPAIPVLRYRSVDEAIKRANASIFGLGGSVWGSDVEHAASVAWQLEAGTIFVNTHGTNSVNRRAPYGGMKSSGNGRRAGLEGLAEYFQTHTLTTWEHN